MTNETNQLENVVALNATMQHPIEINVVVMTVELICSVVGIPINFVISCVIICTKRLRNKPRNIFLLGLVFSNLLTFVSVFMEFSYLISPSQELCQVYFATAGIPYVLFLTNMLLALACRYVAIVRPLWHKEKITVRLAVFSQLGASIFISVIYKFGYIAQLLPLNCELQLIQLKIIASILLILFSSCIVLQIIVYCRTRKILRKCGRGKRRRAETKETLVSANFPVLVFNLVAQQVITQPIPANYVRESASNPEILEVHISDSYINRLEIEATTTLISSVTSLSIVTGPVILLPFAALICQNYFENPVCSYIFLFLAPYVIKTLVTLHAVYHPTFYFLRSSELLPVLKNCLKR